MKLEFVNHASYIVESGDVQLLHDPWLEGTVFNDGWGLLSQTAIDYERFKDITHIWFSHEHPDHFSPFCINKIPLEYRQRITVLFQQTRDHRVVEFCRKQNFKEIIELSPGQRVRLGSEMEITCCPFPGFDDSWSYVETSDCRLLNVNDCAIFSREAAEAIKKQVGQVDILLTQFSISAWDGNAEELVRRTAGSRKMLERTIMHADVFEPKYLVPIASFIWFCHEENDYMNEAVLDINEIYESLVSNSEAITMIMYPGDVWRYGENHSSARAVEHYHRDMKSIAGRSRKIAKYVTADDLVEASQGFCLQLRDASDLLKLRIHLTKASYKRRRNHPGGSTIRDLFGLLLLRVDPARIYVSDHGQSYIFDLMEGLRSATFEEKECDVVLGSESLHYSFKFLWGGETLFINGRFREVYPGGRNNLFHYFHLAGNQVAGRPIRWRTLPDDVLRKLRRAS